MKDLTRVALLRGAILADSPIALPAGTVQIVLDAKFDYDALGRLESSRPDVVVLDLRGLQGTPTAPMAAVRAALPGARIVVIGTAGDEGMAQTALAGGASGYVSRDPSPEAVFAAVSGAARGAMHLTATARRAVQKLMVAATPTK
jgi:DNA-binding NarL/FixJ family response regulator